MTPQLYIKLTQQIARQTPEAEALEARAAAMQPGIDSARAWVDACQVSVESAQSALAEARAVEGADTTTQQDALSAANAALATAKDDLAKAKAPQDDALAHARQVRAAIVQCQAALAESGTTMTVADIAQQRLTVERAAIWERIKAHRDQLKGGGVKVGAKWFHSDPDSRIQQLGLVMMGASVPPVQWKTMDGTFVQMSQTLAGQIFAATAASDMALFTHAETLRAQVDASADPGSVDIGAGWPDTFMG